MPLKVLTSIIGSGKPKTGAAAGAAPTIDTQTALADVSLDVTTTISATLGATATLIMVLVSHVRGPANAITGITWNGDALTSPLGNPGSATIGGNLCYSEIWYRVSPATGTHDIIITFPATPTDGWATVISFNGANTSTPVGTFAANNGTTTPVTVDVTSAVNELVIDNVHDSFPTSTLVVGANQASKWNNTTAGGARSAGSTEAGAATVTMSWTNFAGDGWVTSSIPVKP